MSPEGLRFAPEEKPEDTTEKKTKQRKKKSHLRLVPLVEVAEDTKAETPKQPSGVVETLLQQSKAERDEKAAESKEKAESTSTEKGEKNKTEAPADIETAPESLEASDTEKDEQEETYEKLYQELTPVDLNRGEVIIRLNGNEPVMERVIPLHVANETNAPEEPEQPETNQISPAEPFVVERISEPEQPAVGGGSGGGEMPPTPPTSFEVIPSPDHEPPTPSEQYVQPLEVTHEGLVSTPEYRYPATDEGSSYAPRSGEKIATRQELEDAEYYAAKAAQGRGVATGLFVGGLYEHWKHKRRQKRIEKKLEAQSKELKQARKDQHFEKQKHEAEKQEFQRRYNALEKKAESPARPDKLTRRPERAQPDVPEQLAIPDDHRIETSAWHAIEVDAKTGKAVEKPTFQYGHEYYRERAQENRPLQQRNAAAGEVALVAAAAAAANGNQAQAPSPTVPMIPSASTQGPPSATKQAAKPSASTADKTASNTGPIWPWLVALVVIVVLLAILIR